MRSRVQERERKKKDIRKRGRAKERASERNKVATESEKKVRHEESYKGEREGERRRRWVLYSWIYFSFLKRCCSI